MSDPFRGGSDPKGTYEFSQHLGVAEDQLEQIEAIPRRIEALKTGKGVTQALMDGLALQYTKGWETLWDQLQASREICRKLGRDVGAYDAARAAAGDIYVDVAKGGVFKLGNRVEIKWWNRPTTSAHGAIKALRAAMPDVVVVEQAPLDVDLRPSSHKAVELVQVLIGVGVLLAVVYAIYRAVS